MPPDLTLLSTLTGSNLRCLELIFMVPKLFEQLKFDCNFFHKSFNFVLNDVVSFEQLDLLYNYNITAATEADGSLPLLNVNYTDSMAQNSSEAFLAVSNPLCKEVSHSSEFFYP